MSRFDSWFAELVAALFTWVLLLVFEAVLVGAAYQLGWWRRGVHEDREAKKARVLRAAEDAAAETITLPTQRVGAE